MKPTTQIYSVFLDAVRKQVDVATSFSNDLAATGALKNYGQDYAEALVNFQNAVISRSAILNSRREGDAARMITLVATRLVSEGLDPRKIDQVKLEQPVIKALYKDERIKSEILAIVRSLDAPLRTGAAGPAPRILH